MTSAALALKSIYLLKQSFATQRPLTSLYFTDTPPTEDRLFSRLSCRPFYLSSSLSRWNPSAHPVQPRIPAVSSGNCLLLLTPPPTHPRLIHALPCCGLRRELATSTWSQQHRSLKVGRAAMLRLPSTPDYTNLTGHQELNY